MDQHNASEERDPASNENAVHRIVEWLINNRPQLLARLVKTGKNIDDLVIDLLGNRSTASSGSVDRSWVPVSDDSMMSFEFFLDKILQQCLSPDSVRRMRSSLLEIRTNKGKAYSDSLGVDSCYRRGYNALFENFMRKVDRIESMSRRSLLEQNELAQSEASAEGEGDAVSKDQEIETLYVTFRDAAVYSILIMRFLEAMERHQTVKTGE